MKAVRRVLNPNGDERPFFHDTPRANGVKRITFASAASGSEESHDQLVTLKILMLAPRLLPKIP